MARLLAPLALIAFAAALVAVILGSDVVGSDEGSGRAGTSDLRTATGRAGTTEKPRRNTRATYTIKANDTLTGIAERTGVSVERLQELNPELDPQGLVAGQKIKLRE